MSLITCGDLRLVIYASVNFNSFITGKKIVLLHLELMADWVPHSQKLWENYNKLEEEIKLLSVEITV